MRQAKTTPLSAKTLATASGSSSFRSAPNSFRRGGSGASTDRSDRSDRVRNSQYVNGAAYSPFCPIPISLLPNPTPPGMSSTRESLLASTRLHSRWIASPIPRHTAVSSSSGTRRREQGQTRTADFRLRKRRSRTSCLSRLSRRRRTCQSSISPPEGRRPSRSVGHAPSPLSSISFVSSLPERIYLGRLIYLGRGILRGSWRMGFWFARLRFGSVAQCEMFCTCFSCMPSKTEEGMDMRAYSMDMECPAPRRGQPWSSPFRVGL